jgi:hypothetical protein
VEDVDDGRDGKNEVATIAITCCSAISVLKTRQGLMHHRTHVMV